MKRLVRDIGIGIAGGIAATALTGLVDKALTALIPESQKARERRVRDGTAHEVAGPLFGRKIVGRPLSDKGKKVSKAAFSVSYGILWGVIYALARRIPGVARWGGLPFALPFFAACDGLIAPLLKLTPHLKEVPWAFNAKELGNHIAWTAGAETAHRLAARTSSSRSRRAG